MVGASSRLLARPLSCCVVLPLLGPVMAGLAEALDVAVIPEQALVTSVRLLMVSYQQAGVRLCSSAHSASEQVADQDGPAQAAPTWGLVPLAPLDGVALLIVLFAALWRLDAMRSNGGESGR